MSETVQFYTATYNQYKAAEKDNNTLYFLTDTQQIMKGNYDYTSSVMFVDGLPSTGIPGRLYIVNNKNKAYQYKNVGGYLVRVKAFDIEGAVKYAMTLTFTSVEEANVAFNTGVVEGYYGRLITIKNDNKYVPYVVQPGVEERFRVEPLNAASIEWEEVNSLT